MGQDREGFLRILYEVEQQTAAGRAADGDSADATTAQPWHIRVPACADSPAHAALLWTDLILGRLGSSTPVLALVPLSEGWVDLIVGEPTTEQFYCILASQKAIPLTSDVPYQIDEDFRQRAEQFIETLHSGEIRPMAPPQKQAELPKRVSPKKAAPEHAALPPAHAASRSKRPLRLLVIIGAVVVALALAIVLVMAIASKQADDPIQDQEPEAPTGAELSVFDAEAWKNLCDAYYEWFGSFLGELNRGRRARWAKDPHLKTIIDAIERKEVEFDPRKIAGAPSRSIHDLRDNLPEEAKTRKLIAKAWSASKIMEKVEATLAQWPARLALQALVEEGYAGPALAKDLNSLLAQVGPHSHAAKAVDNLLDNKDMLARVASSLQRVRKPEIADDTVVSMIARLSKKETRTANDLKSLAAKLQDLEKVVGRIALLWKETQVHHKTLENAGEAIAGKFREYFRSETDQAKDLNSLSARMQDVTQVAAGIASDSEAVRRLILGDDAIATKVRELVDSQAAVADDLEDLNKKLNRMKKGIRDVSGLAESVRARGKEIAQANNEGSKVLARFPDYLKAESEKAKNLSGLLKKLRDVDAVAADLTAFLNKDWRSDEKFAREILVAEEKEPEAQPTRETFTSWLKTAKGYYRLADDPRNDWMKAEKSIAGLIASYRALEGRKQALLEDFENRLPAITRRIDAVRDPTKTPGIEKNRKLIFGGERKGLAGTIAKLRADVEKVTVPRPKLLTQLLEDLRKGKNIPAAFKQMVWPKVHESAGRELDVDKIRYWRLKKVIPDLQAQLIALEKEFAVPDTRLKAHAQRKRDQALQQVVGMIPWVKLDGLEQTYPDLSNKAFVAKKNRALDELKQWADTLAVLFKDSQAIADRLNESWHRKDLLDHKPNNKAESIRTLYGKQYKSAVFREAGVAAAFEATASRVVTLLKIEKATDKKELIGFVQNDRIEAVAAAWRKLGQVAHWPNGLQELMQEADIREKLKNAKFPAKELAAQGPPRWGKCLQSLSDCSQIAKALELMADFGVSVEKLGHQAQYNLLLWEFAESLRAFRDQIERTGAKKQEALLKRFAPKITDFERSVAGLPKRIRDKEPVKLFMAATAELKKEGGGEGDVDKFGPAAAGWTLAAGSTRARLKYNWPKNRPTHTLEFVRIESKLPSHKVFYLCATEVSAELFLDLANEREAIRKLLWKPKWRGDTLRGPRVWQWRAKQIGSAKQWISIPVLAGREDSYYPDTIKPGQPRGEHPMQRVSPQAAKAFCEAMGCRLPAAAEWAEAYRAHEKYSRNVRWNLRDWSWQEEQAHVRKMKKEIVTIDWPTEGIFLPKDHKKEATQEAEPVIDENDGHLWLAPVGSTKGATIHHLVGNVAEFVYEDVEGFGVVGGSALSPPQLWDGKRRGYSRTYPVDMRTAVAGYSDVGFRVAFSAPSPTVKARLAVLLQDFPCLENE